jgi:hypothetical protein
MFLYLTKFWLERLIGGYHSEDLGGDGRITLKWIQWEIGFSGVDWIHLAYDRDQWWAVVSKVMNLQVP